MIDIHSHILPGIDDGAKTMSDSVEIVRELAGYGITDMIATPHYVSETNFVSSRATNAKLVIELRKMLAVEHINVNIYLGNEIYIDKGIKELVRAKQITPLAGSRYLLVELPLDDEFPNYEDVLKDLVDSGANVILAHPERYVLIQKDFEIAENLHKMGVLFQCNMGSITGKYGKSAKKLLKKLAKNKMIFTFGTDVHHRGRSDYLPVAQKKLLKYYSKRELEQLLVVNPRKIIGSNR